MFIIVYIENMYKVFKTESYLKWFKKLRDSTAKYAIILRIERLKNSNFGDSKSVGEKVFELRIDTEKGYIVYFTNKDKEITRSKFEFLLNKNIWKKPLGCIINKMK